MQKAHFHAHGTTLAGLMKRSRRRSARFPRLRPRHRARPGDRRRAPGRGAAAAAGPQVRLHQRRRALCPARARRGSASHGHFDGLHDIHASELMCPSPIRTAMRRCASGSASIPARALFADDMVRNLAPAKALGMTTVWVDNGSEQRQPDFDETDRRCTGRTTSATGWQASWERKWHERGAANA